MATSPSATRRNLPWDSGYHRFFEHPEVIHDLLQGFAPAALGQEIRLEQPEIYKTDFYSQHFEKRDGDLLFRFPRRGRPGQAWLWFLLELQLQPDRFMPLRVMTYLSLLQEHLVQQHGLKAGDKLPPVFAMVFYHGPRPWREPTALRPPIDLPPDSPLSAWQPQMQFWLIQEQYADVPLEGQTNLAALLMALNQCRDAEQLTRVLARFDQVTHVERHAQLRALLLSWSLHVLDRKHKLKVRREHYQSLLEDQAMGLEYYADQIVHELETRGEARGEARGQQRGLLQARRQDLLELLELRFGPAPEWEALVQSTEDQASLQRWFRAAVVAPDAEALREALEALRS